MATRWSSQFTIAEHKDLQANAMAVDMTGTYVLLAGRRFLGVKKLDDPSDILRKFSRQSKYDVGTAEWNPNFHEKDICAISSNQRVEVYRVTGSEMAQAYLLSGHTRVVTDMNWHRFNPELIASCSIDTYTNIWDLRDSRRPVLSLSSVAGANQVRWNRQSQYLLATAHNGDIRLWDQRKGTAPVQYITAHLANIHGLDWSPTLENQLATSSQDCTVKFFDTTNPRRAENIISATSPVWRARYTPFGDGLIMVVVPPMRRGENSLLLWNLNNPSAPVHTFVGHTDTVLEFDWRKHKDDSTDYQLITWSKDQTLRIWQIESFLQKLCGHDPDGDNCTAGNVLSNVSTIGSEAGSEVLLDTGSSTLSEESLSETDVQLSSSSSQAGPPTSDTLQQEFSNTNIPNVNFEKFDATKRSCSVKVTVGNNVVLLHITFPASYPYGSMPTFQFMTGSTLDIVAKTRLLKVLKHTAQQRVHKNRSCLELCLKHLVKTLEQLSNNDETDKTSSRNQISPLSLVDHAAIFSSFQDASVPFPRTSGAKFCSVGLLVTFGRSLSARRLSSRSDTLTPRSLPEPVMAVSSPYYFSDRTNGAAVHPRVNRGSLSRSLRASKALVIVYDASGLFLIQRNLAERYILDTQNVVRMCQRNAAIAGSVGRKDLVQAWSLAALASSPTPTPAHAQAQDQDDDFPWHSHPLACNMLHSIIWHFAKQCDIQMAAMLTCVLGAKPDSHHTSFKQKPVTKTANISRVANGKWWIQPGGSPYHTIHTSSQGWNFSVLKQNRSNSWSESLDDCRLSNNIVEHFAVNTEVDRDQEVDEDNSLLYNEYKRAYAEILYRWRLLNTRAQVLKCLSTMPEPHRGVELTADCQHCHKPAQDAYCSSCKRPSLQCVICNLSVRGAMSCCLVCGHGGHSKHLQDWFRKEKVCPSGCGCYCLFQSASLLEP